MDAGRHDPATLTASLVLPGASVAVAMAAPLGLQPLLEARGCPIVDVSRADLVIGGPSDIPAGRPGILTTANLDHGAIHLGAPAPAGALSNDDLRKALAAVGHPQLATVRCFEPFPADGLGASLQTDPRAWVNWQAVLAGPAHLAPPAPQPDDVPERTVLVLATDPFGAWELPRRRMLLALNEVVRAAGGTLVLGWDDQRLTGSLAAHVDLTRCGIVLHGGDGVFDVEGASNLVARPGTRALVNAYLPEAVVVMDQSMADTYLAVGAAEVPTAQMFGMDFDDPPVETGVPMALMVSRIAEVLATDAALVPQRIAVVEPRKRLQGVTSVVIPVHGRWDLTEVCLQTLRVNTSRPLEIIVVDNASPDETPQRLAELDGVTTITCATNLGFAGGTNVGLKAANGEFVCLLNNDTEVMPGWLEAMHDALAVEGTGMVGPRSNSISGLQFILDGPDMDDLEVARRWGRAQAAAGAGNTWRILRLVGFAMMLRGDLLEEVGGLDEGVGLGNYEDDDLCQRIRRRGLHLRVADGAVVLHHGSATFLDADISALGTARQGARHLGSRLDAWSDLVVARVIADADPECVELVVSTARMVADETVVVCNGPTLPWALRTKYVNARAVDIVRADPSVDVRPTRAEWVLHLSGNTPVDHSDWGLTRSAVEALPRTAHAIADIPGATLVPVVDGTMGPAPSPTGLPVTNAIRPAHAS